MSQETKKQAQMHHWNFQRIGGLDQVVLSSGEDIRHLAGLDPKLWVALSCPTQGLEFDARVLAWLDADADGHIRIPEVIETVQWTCAQLDDLDGMLKESDILSLEALNTQTDEGKKLLATAKTILEERGKADTAYLTQEDVTQASAQAAQAVFNGDGVFPALTVLDHDMAPFIQDALAVTGGVMDMSGQPGVNLEIAQAFVQTLSDWLDWHKGLDVAPALLAKIRRRCGIWRISSKIR